MAGTSIAGRDTPLIPPPKERKVLRERVGAFIRVRRTELGLSSGDITRALGYRTLASCWKIEKGLEGLPTKRVFAWADILELPRDAFFRFVTGETEQMEGGPLAKAEPPERLTVMEADLLRTFRKLTPKNQRGLQDHAEAVLFLQSKRAAEKK
jgi:hypothetical protein